MDYLAKEKENPIRKWMYLIFPAALLALFLAVYVAETHKREAREAATAQKVAMEKKDKEEKDAALRARANAEADKRTADRAIADKKKEDERIAKWLDEGKKIESETTLSNSEVEKATKQIAQLESDLAKMRETREKGNRDYLDLLKKSQTAQIERRTSEAEIKRLLTMIERRAVENAAPRPVAPPAPARSE